jgi:endoglucanase
MNNRILSFLMVITMVAWAGTGIGADWKTFKTDFISEDGRVIDRINNEISHSEGQGYALLLAVHHGDRDTFDTLWAWTKSNLQVRGNDKLLAWKWGQRETGQWDIIDLNNASDGDILVAWALLRAGRKWHDSGLEQAAADLAADVLLSLQHTWQDLALIMPGYFGFIDPPEIIFNPSYLIFPAFQDFSSAWPNQAAQWQRIHQDGITLLGRMTFTSLTLPPDWVKLTTENAQVDASRSPWFGYDAIRIPLYLALNGEQAALSTYIPFLDTIEAIGYLPRGVDLTRSTVHLEPGPAGFWAVLARAARELGRHAQAERLHNRADELIRHETSDYYSRVLYLLAALNVETDMLQ